VEVRRECTAPLGNRIEAEYLWDEEERTAVIEIARCSGLSLVPPEARDVMHSGTAGVGDLLADALDRGARKVLMGLGGSATSDCAIGMLMRLEELLAPPRRAGLSRCAADLAGMDAPDARRLRETFAGIELTGCTDVRNPLCGPAGCAARFAPQKGADPEQVAWLDAHIGNWAGGIEQQLEKCLREIPGAGAAGGLGFGVAVLGGQLVPGARLFLELAGFDRKLADADAVVTSEGRFDSTSFDGKAPWQVACTAREAGRRAIIVCGSADAHAAETARREGVDIITFGEGIPVQLRAAASPGLISKAIAAFLLSR
jgi:glycerate kinase